MIGRFYEIALREIFMLNGEGENLICWICL